MLGKWMGRDGDAPIEFEVFPDRTVKVWRQGLPTTVTYRWTDAARAIVDMTEVRVEFRDGELVLTDAQDRSLRFRRPPDPNLPPPRFASAREFFEHRREAMKRRDYAAVWAQCGPEYRDRVAAMAQLMLERHPASLEHLGFARRREEIDPVEIALRFWTDAFRSCEGEWSLEEVLQEGSSATLRVRIGTEVGSTIASFALESSGDTWFEQWSDAFSNAISWGILKSRKTRCLNNLTQLWKIQQNYVGRYAHLPPSTGGSFWLALTTTDPPLIPGDYREIFSCPLERTSSQTTHYRGPMQDANTLRPDDIVGACLGHHSDESGFVVFKDGTVRHVAKEDDLYLRAKEDTKP